MSERINVHLPVLSPHSRSVIGDAREDRRTITSHRATMGGHIRQPGGPGEVGPTPADATDGPPSAGSRSSIRSVGSLGSIGSIGSIGSVLSIGSAGSVLSIGSAGSVLSIGSAGSVLSIGSAGSVLSIGSGGSVLSIGSEDAVAGHHAAAERLVGAAATALTLSALLTVMLGRRG